MTDTTDNALDALVARLTAITGHEYASRDQCLLNCDLGTIAMGDVADLLGAITALRASEESARNVAAVSKAFHDLAVGERNRAWDTIASLRAERDKWEDATHTAQNRYFDVVADRDAEKARADAAEARVASLTDIIATLRNDMWQAMQDARTAALREAADRTLGLAGHECRKVIITMINKDTAP